MLITASIAISINQEQELDIKIGRKKSWRRLGKTRRVRILIKDGIYIWKL